MKNKITLIVPIESKPDTRDTVRKRLLEMAELTRKETGNINYILHEITEKPGSFVIYENWRDQAALNFHMNQDYLKRFLADAESLLAEDIKGTFCEVFGE